MDHIVAWSHAALDDMDEIAEYIHKDSPFYASVVIDKIKQSTRRLYAQPYSGRAVPEAKNDSVREVFIYDYRLIYEVLESEGTLLILAIFHGRRDMNVALSERLE